MTATSVQKEDMEAMAVMKKMIMTLLVVTLVLCCTAAALAESVNVHIIGNCNVRSSPSLNGTILGSVSDGSTLKGSGEVRTDKRGVDWFNVTYKGKKGWVSSKYAYTSKSSGKSSKTTKYVVGDTGKSNVHTGPGLNYKIIGVLHVDESARYLNKTSVDGRGVVWYKISWDGRNAWVSSKYTCIDGKGKSSGTVIADGGDCHVRTGPALGYKSIGVLYEDEEASFRGKTSTDDRGVLWYRINWEGRTGWVSSKYASLY